MLLVYKTRLYLSRSITNGSEVTCLIHNIPAAGIFFVIQHIATIKPHKNPMR